MMSVLAIWLTGDGGVGLLLRPGVVQRLARPGLWSRDQDHRDQRVGLVIETETQTSKVSRPRLIETKEFPSCRDRDLSRLENLVVVETETHRDWMKIVETETLTRLFKEVF